MALELVDLLKFVAPPIVAVVGGWLGSAWRMGSRVRKVEGKTKLLDAKIEALKAGFRLEIDTLKNDDIEELDQDLKKLTEALGRIRASQSDYTKEAAFAQFMIQEHERWERVQRTLGRMEGVMETWRSRPTSSPPKSR